jgi:hypothetical protein
MPTQLLTLQVLSANEGVALGGSPIPGSGIAKV